MEKDIILFFILPALGAWFGYQMGRTEYSKKLVAVGTKDSIDQLLKGLNFSLYVFLQMRECIRVSAKSVVNDYVKGKNNKLAAMSSLENTFNAFDEEMYIGSIEKELGITFHKAPETPYPWQGETK